jgi:hypothetical protein
VSNFWASFRVKTAISTYAQLSIITYQEQCNIHTWLFLTIKPLDALIPQIYFGMKLYMFRTVPLSIVGSFSLYTQQWHMSYKFADSLWAKLYDLYHCCVYSEKLPMMDRGSVWNMQIFIPKHIWGISASSWFYCKILNTMHGHMNVKYMAVPNILQYRHFTILYKQKESYGSVKPTKEKYPRHFNPLYVWLLTPHNTALPYFMYNIKRKLLVRKYRERNT